MTITALPFGTAVHLPWPPSAFKTGGARGHSRRRTGIHDHDSEGRDIKIATTPGLWRNHPGAYLSMGLTAERLAERFNITREEADNFSLGRHQRLRCHAAGNFAVKQRRSRSFTPTTYGQAQAHRNLSKPTKGSPRSDTTLASPSCLRPLSTLRHRHR